jgi:hypothetical protein
VNKIAYVGIIAGILALSTLAAIGTLNLNIASASKCGNPTPCDGWGDSTSDAATKDGQAVGEHAKTADDKPGPGRDGLGNFAGEQTGNKNPSDLGDIVGGNLP